MNPAAIPVAILYESGIVIIVRNEGTAISKRDHSILPRDETMSTPTMINAGAVTGAVTTDRTGKKNSASRKNPAVTREAKPLRAPEATPADDSIYEVVVDVPRIDPTIDAIESAKSARPARGSLLSFINPAWFATATSVPALSKKSTNRKVKIMPTIVAV